MIVKKVKVMDLRDIKKLENFHHKADIQLRFNDVDILGHVNNTVYFSLYDLGKALYFKAVREDGFDFRQVDTIIANINCTYRSPILFGEQIEVLTKTESIGEKSFKLLQALREKNTGEIKSLCETVMVGYDAVQRQSREIPEEWRKAFENFEGMNIGNE